MAMRKRARRGLASTSVADIEAELRQRRSGVGRLQARYAALSRRLATLALEIESMGGIAPGTGAGLRAGRRRAKNKQTLVDALAGVLDGRTMSVTEVSQQVQKAGYVTTSPNFRTIVNQTLINSGRFRRAERGRYTLKK